MRRQRAESGATRQRQGHRPLRPPGGVGPCDTWLSDAGPQGPESLTVCGSGLRPPQGTGPGSPWCWRGWLGSPGSGFWNAPWALGLRARKEGGRKPHPSLSGPQRAPVPGAPLSTSAGREGSRGRAPPARPGTPTLSPGAGPSPRAPRPMEAPSLGLRRAVAGGPWRGRLGPGRRRADNRVLQQVAGEEWGEGLGAPAEAGT